MSEAQNISQSILKLMDTEWQGGDLPRLKNAAPEWLQHRRARGVNAASALGLPSPKNERWKYTNLAPVVAQESFQQAMGVSVDSQKDVPDTVLDVDGIPIVLVNGRLSVQLSALGRLPSGVRVLSLTDAMIDEEADLEDLLSVGDSMDMHGLRAANDAQLSTGLLIRVAADHAVTTPLHVISISTSGDVAKVMHPRVLVDLDRHAELSLVESHVSQSDACVAFKNWVVQIRLADGAKLNHVKWQNEAETATHVATVDVSVGQHATYTGFVAHVGGKVARHDVRVDMQAEGGHADLNGVYIGDGPQVHDITSLVKHSAAHATSSQMVRGVVGNGARGVFLGKAVVAKDAQKTDARQMHNALILDKTGEVNAKPELEIYADDVQCAHGNTVGDLSEDALFYLRARGVSEADARAMLIEGFLTQVVDTIPAEALQMAVSDKVLARLKELTS